MRARPFTGMIVVVNNLAYNNAQGNYKFDVAGPKFYNNVSFFIGNSGTNDRYGGSSGIATGPSNIFWFNGATKNDSSLTVSSKLPLASSRRPSGRLPKATAVTRSVWPRRGSPRASPLLASHSLTVSSRLAYTLREF